MKRAKQADWNPSELYNRLVQALGDQRTSLSSALNVAADFLYQLWLEPIPTNQREYLTLGLLDGLTGGTEHPGGIEPTYKSDLREIYTAPLS